MYNRDTQGGGMTRRPQGALSRPGWSGMDPWRDLEEMQRRMDSVFNRFFGFNPPDFYGQIGQSSERGIAQPDVDLYENDQEFILTAALPGVDPNDIQVEATESALLLSAETRSQFDNQSQNGNSTQSGTQNAPGRGAQTSQGGAAGLQPSDMQAGAWQQPHTQHLRSRQSSMARYQFTYTLPSEIKPDQVRAEFRNGMLELHLPKMQSTANRRVPIQVQTSGSTSQTQMTGGRPGTASPSTLTEGSMPSQPMAEHSGRADQRMPEQGAQAGSPAIPKEASSKTQK